MREKEFLSYLEKHSGIIHKVCRMYVDDREDQADLQQEIVYQLWRSYPKFKGQSAFSTWLYRVALNTAILYFKRSQKRIATVELSSDNQTVDVRENEDYNDKMVLFYAAAKALSKVEKAVIFLFMEGLSHREIGDQMGWSEGNARVRLMRAKNKLKDNIKKLEK